MKEYRKEFIKDWDEAGGLIRQKDAADLLQWSRQRIYSRIQTGSLRAYEYNNAGKKLIFLSLNDIKKIAITEKESAT